MIPSRIEDEVVVLLQVVTRAQAKEKIESIKGEQVQSPTKKRKQKSWRERKARIVAEELKEEEERCQYKERKMEGSSSSNDSKHEGRFNPN